MSVAKWESTTKSAAILSLDSRNPRLAQITQQATERELIGELVANEDIYSLARSIAESGYFPNEALVAVREQSKTVVVEGNRRLAACKLLISPEAAPSSAQGKFRSLSAKANLSQLSEIPVCIAPSREATYALVLKRHTQLPISKWEPVMQAKFYRQLIGANVGSEYSRSANAALAEDNGRLPRTRAAKFMGVSAKAFDLGCRAAHYESAEWHHVGKYAQRVQYYDTQELAVSAEFWRGAASAYSAQRAARLLAERRAK